jgi:hypothetical protein
MTTARYRVRKMDRSTVLIDTSMRLDAGASRHLG